MRQFPLIPDGEPWGLEARLVLNNAMRGKMNVVEEVTLTANAASTVVTDALVNSESLIVLMPTTANAAAALATTYIATVGDGTFTITHANNAQADKTFRYGVLG